MENIEKILSEYRHFEQKEIENNIEQILKQDLESNRNQEALETIFGCIDLTSLNTTDTETSISNWIEKVNQFGDDYPEMPHVAAVCIYPSMIATVKDLLTENVEIASVTGGFPHSQTFMEIKIAETSLAVLEGASEIDTVLSLNKLLDKKYEDIVDEIREIKDACRQAHLKVILETGALTLEQVRIASIISLESGADFIKTSTGKMQPAATLPATYIMCNVIKEFNEKRGKKAGFKAAGGIATTNEALSYYSIVKSVLGNDWLIPELFRFGASRLANNILSDIHGKPIKYF